MKRRSKSHTTEKELYPRGLSRTARSLPAFNSYEILRRTLKDVRANLSLFISDFVPQFQPPGILVSVTTETAFRYCRELSNLTSNDKIIEQKLQIFIAILEEMKQALPYNVNGDSKTLEKQLDSCLQGIRYAMTLVSNNDYVDGLQINEESNNEIGSSPHDAVDGQSSEQSLMTSQEIVSAARDLQDALDSIQII